MTKIMMLLSIVNSSTILSTSHPISLGIILLAQTMVFAICSRILTQSSWVPLTLFLVMIGGLLILFLYMTSISSNKKPTFIRPKFYQLMCISFMMNFLSNFELVISTNEFLNMKDFHNMEFIKLFMSLNMVSSNFMFLYLLVMLIIMIEILSLNKGPMRKKY
uniref:NADH dehydrogenase subunit 6 n=1 Tax=Cacopsylla fuscicella TaxID=3050168 RepID=UPI00257FCA1A|nr:NADH dehydrogenase subunit 6 [Cacopsylla fuscicella]WID86686.1 NADH dehydrogenase subunit 6 [Cacopsylla fuscicella]